MGRFSYIWFTSRYRIRCEYSNDSFDVVGNTDGCTTYYEHETGTDQIKGGTTTAITSNIKSGDFDITANKDLH